MGRKNRHGAPKLNKNTTPKQRRSGFDPDLHSYGHQVFHMPGHGSVSFGPLVDADRYNEVIANDPTADTSVELTDLTLSVALEKKRRTWDNLDDTLWSLNSPADLTEVVRERDLETLYVSLRAAPGGAQWWVFYPATSDTARDPDEVFTDRRRLLAELSRLESIGQEKLREAVAN